MNKPTKTVRTPQAPPQPPPVADEGRFPGLGTAAAIYFGLALLYFFPALPGNYYQDWKVAVDGRAAPLLRTNHMLRGVVVPAGAHRVTFTYEPEKLYTGWYIYSRKTHEVVAE